MSLPASQQRVLDSMENRLRAGEPYLASMFGIFARLNAGEPVSTERLAAGRRWRRPPGALYAVLVFPVIFGLVIIGALLSGGAHGTRTCDVGYSIGGGTALVSRSQCQTAGQPASGSGTVSGTGSGPAGASCPRAAAPASRYVIRTNGDLALPPSAGASPAPGDTSGMC